MAPNQPSNVQVPDPNEKCLLNWPPRELTSPTEKQIQNHREILRHLYNHAAHQGTLEAVTSALWTELINTQLKAADGFHTAPEQPPANSDPHRVDAAVGQIVNGVYHKVLYVEFKRTGSSPAVMRHAEEQVQEYCQSLLARDSGITSIWAMVCTGTLARYWKVNRYGSVGFDRTVFTDAANDCNDNLRALFDEIRG